MGTICVRTKDFARSAVHAAGSFQQATRKLTSVTPSYKRSNAEDVKVAVSIEVLPTTPTAANELLWALEADTDKAGILKQKSEGCEGRHFRDDEGKQSDSDALERSSQWSTASDEAPSESCCSAPVMHIKRRHRWSFLPYRLFSSKKPLVSPTNSERRRRLSLTYAPTGDAPAEEDSLRGVAFVDGREIGGLATARDQQVAVTKTQSRKGYVLTPSRRLSVAGKLSTCPQKEYENKEIAVKFDSLVSSFERLQRPLSSEARNPAEVLTSLGVGYSCKKGLKPDSPNQDDFCIIRNADWSLYGVFDGHGSSGHHVSNFVCRELPRRVSADPEFESNPRVAIRNAFLSTQRLLEEAGRRGLFDVCFSGCTATVVVLRPSPINPDLATLFVAHVGDSRAVMGRMRRPSTSEDLLPTSPRSVMGHSTVALSIDHKPNSPLELPRIIDAGGQVRRLGKDFTYRVFVKNQMYPGLAMSRAIGDVIATSAGVTSEPDITEYHITRGADAFMLLCSDGLWEFISSQEAVDIVGRRLKDGFTVQQTAEELAVESWKRWVGEDLSVVDDTTILVVDLESHFA